MIAQKIAGLNLGSRNRAIPGFLSMDCDAHEGARVAGQRAKANEEKPLQKVFLALVTAILF